MRTGASVWTSAAVLWCLTTGFAHAAPPVAKAAAEPAAMVRQMSVAQRCEIAAALGEEMLHYAIRAGRLDDFFENRRAMLVVFLNGTTDEDAKLIATHERCAPVRKVRVDDEQRAVWTVEVAGPERRLHQLAFVLHLESTLEETQPRFHFSWKTNEPYNGNDRPGPPGTLETGQPLLGTIAPTLHVYVEPNGRSVDRRTELWLAAKSLLIDAP